MTTSRSLERVLSGMLKEAAPAAPRAGWEQRAVEAMAQAAPRVRARRRTAWRWVVAVVVVVAMLLPAGVWWLPRRGGFALANVARAVAHVENAHFVGWELEQSGAHEPKEAWIEPRRARMTEGEVIDEYYDESRFVEIRTEDGHARVTIDPLPDDMAKLLADGSGYLQQLLWPQAAQDALDHRGETLTSWERQRLPDGRSVIVVDLTAGTRVTRMTVDEATDLILRVEAYEGGELVGEIGPIEYNVDIPDEVFQVSIPEGATVIDNMASSSRETARTPLALAAGSRATGDESFFQGSGTSPSPFHTKLHFETLGDGEVTITYLPRTNAYRVKGAVRVTSMGLNRVVENTEFVAPGPPDVTVEQYKAERARQQQEWARRMPPPEVQRWREAKRKELVAAGAEGYGMCGGMLGIGGYYFDVLNERIIEVWYLRSKNAFYVMGKAHVHGHGTDQVVEDGWVKVTGPPPAPLEPEQ